jgi:RNA polymerase sigma factor (sigma-70 family)
MEPSDADVIAASLAEPAAFGAIFDRHASTMLRYFGRRVEPAAAEGLLGEVFRIAFEQRASFDPSRASARPWLYGIAANLVGRHRRSERRRLHAMARLAARQPIDQNDVVGEHAAGSLDAAEAWSRLAGTVDLLPAVEREALLLFAWENLSYDDIADALGVPVGTVRSRLNRARRRLREHDSSKRTQTSRTDLTEADTDDR